MKSLLQVALGDDWNKLPPTLQAHYRLGDLKEEGDMDIEYPWWMQGYLDVLRWCGALVNRRGKGLCTIVEKNYGVDGQRWRRAIYYPSGETIFFDSLLVSAGGNELIEFVNPFLGLQMSVGVSGNTLHYSGVRYVCKLGAILIPIPEWLVLGHTVITESAVDDNHYQMDFRLLHPWFGQLFRYAGVFRVDQTKVNR